MSQLLDLLISNDHLLHHYYISVFFIPEVTGLVCVYINSCWNLYKLQKGPYSALQSSCPKLINSGPYSPLRLSGTFSNFLKPPSTTLKPHLLSHLQRQDHHLLHQEERSHKARTSTLTTSALTVLSKMQPSISILDNMPTLIIRNIPLLVICLSSSCIINISV